MECDLENKREPRKCTINWNEQIEWMEKKEK